MHNNYVSLLPADLFTLTIVDDSNHSRPVLAEHDQGKIDLEFAKQSLLKQIFAIFP